MKTKEVVLSQEEMVEALNNFLIKSYIANGIIKVTPKSVKKELNFNITKEILNDEIMSMRCCGIELEIQAQCELDNQNDFLKYYDKVSKKITTFDFSKYESMTIEELRSYLLVWDENVIDSNVRGENLIKDKVERACVAVYSIPKGGTYISKNRDSDIDNMLERISEMSVNNELSEENRAKLLKALV